MVDKLPALFRETDRKTSWRIVNRIVQLSWWCPSSEGGVREIDSGSLARHCARHGPRSINCSVTRKSSEVPLPRTIVFNRGGH